MKPLIAAVFALALVTVPAAASEGLPPDAALSGTFITVDVSTNTAYFFHEDQLVEKARVATGSDKLLKRGRKVWLFRTPRGRHKVMAKITDPVWRKPDWAFVEEGKKIPSANSPLRLEKGKLGKFALHLGDGIMIHGTKEKNSFGRKASHGCIRMPDSMLARVYRKANVGMDVYIFDSAPSVPIMDGGGLSDLDYPAR